jgi:hypothetical protein
MKITFVRDRQPDPLNGNSFYPAGTRADLRYGAELVALGVAREGWGADPAVIVAPAEIPSTTMPDPTPTKPKQPRRKG